MGGDKKSGGLLSAFRSASESNLAKDPPTDLASRQSDSGQQGPQQAALSPPTSSRSRRFLNRLGWKSSSSSPHRSPSPGGVEPRNSTTDHHVATSASPPDDHGSPDGPDDQGSPSISTSAPTSAPIILVSHPPPEPITSVDPAPSPACIPTSTCHVHAQAQTDARIPKPPNDPEAAIEPPPHSSVVWAKTLQIAKQKLKDNNLPPLDDPTDPTSQSVGGNIGAVVESLNTLQEDAQKGRWRYTWRGKEIIIAERLGEILRSMDKYSHVVGTVVQCDPQVSALVWGGVQAIMRVCIHVLYWLINTILILGVGHSESRRSN